MRFIRHLSLIIFLLIAAAAPADAQPKWKFSEVREVAPGVFFRYASISATDKSIFGGCNNIWVVFEDYVVVIDANFPREAKDVIAAVKKTTDKPIRYVFDTHHHGDHAYGNAAYVKQGASVMASANCAHLLRTVGPKQFKEAGMGPTGRKDIAAAVLKAPTVVFDEKLVLDDGKQRLEFLFFGHAHTAGDAVAYLPKHKLVCTGDACVNGAFNFMGHSDSASWIRVLDNLQQLDVKTVCPGHGLPTGPELLQKQKRYFIELRQQVQKGINANLEVPDIIKKMDMPWYKEWTGIDVKQRVDNIRHVYGELTGSVKAWDLLEEFGLYEGPSPTKDSPGWTKPKRIVIPAGLMPRRIAELKKVAPEIEFVPVKSAKQAARAAIDADAVLGLCTPEIVKAGKKLRWIQAGDAKLESILFPSLVQSRIVLTDARCIHGPNKADQAMALLLALTRGLAGNAGKDRMAKELHGKTLLVIGLGNVGKEVARRARAFGMRVMAIDPKEAHRPSFVFSLDKPAGLMKRLPSADAVVLASPLTGTTKGMIDSAQLRAMKKGCFLINVGSGDLVQTAALAQALSQGHLGGAGLDNPLPGDHPLLKMQNVVISPLRGSAGTHDRQWRLYKENIRRFVNGERLLCVVEKRKGIN